MPGDQNQLGPFGGGGGSWVPWEGLNAAQGELMGLLGNQRYKAKGYDIDPNAFVDPNAEANRQRYMQALQGYQNRQVGGEFQQGQRDLISALQAQASGQGPSLTQNQLQRATDRGLSQAAALQQSQRGMGNAGLQARQLQNTQAGISQQMAGQSADLRLQEQLAARQQLGGVLGQARGQDFQQQAMNDDLVKYYEGLGFSTDQAAFQAQMALENLRVQEALGQQTIGAGLAKGKDELWGGVLGGAAGGAGGGIMSGLLASSDERQKTNVQDGAQLAESFLDALAARSYRYKDPGMPGAAPGPQLGVMAQDLQRGPGGDQLVVDTPQGKMIEPGGGIGAALAGLGNLHERMKALEGGRAGGSPALAERASRQAPEGDAFGKKLIEYFRSSRVRSAFDPGGGSIGGVGGDLSLEERAKRGGIASAGVGG